MHLELYLWGRESVIRLWNVVSVAKQTNILDTLSLWPCVYNTVSIMVNHCSPYHVDINGKVEWFDQLLTVGQYNGLDMDNGSIFQAANRTWHRRYYRGPSLSGLVYAEESAFCIGNL
ncbi:hypothetical protein JVU11DRAFT_12146 [Chiua virens]|nr:hypothetical protein JVU11DRAFT_12146 [Chiua virens]